MLRILLTIVFVIACVAMTVIVLMQEGKSAGLGALTGASETYWSKNKGRSKEGRLAIATTILAVLFMALSLVLNILVRKG